MISKKKYSTELPNLINWFSTLKTFYTEKIVRETMKGILLKYLSIQSNVIDLSSNQQYEINRKLKFYHFLIYFSLIKIFILIKYLCMEGRIK